MSRAFEEIKTIVFLHIPKTAGTSIVNFLIKGLDLKEEEVYNCGFRAKTHIEGNINFIKLSSYEKQKYKFICGHVEYFLLQSIDYPHFSFTLLRNPVDRIISLYFYILENEKHHLHKIVKENKMNISDFMRSGLWIELDNGMLRRLIGALNVPYGRCNYKMLEVAKYNLENKINLFGFQEKFDEFINIISDIFSIENRSYKKENVTKNRKSLDDIDKEAINIIKIFNTLDLELYDYALNLYEKRKF